MIYGITEKGDGRYIKIGVTGEAAISLYAARTRLDALQTGNPRTLILVALAPGSAELERELHARFRPHRERGEWFRHAGAVTRWVARWRVEASEPAEPAPTIYLAPAVAHERTEPTRAWSPRAQPARVRCDWCSKMGHELEACDVRRAWSLSDAVSRRVRHRN